MNAHAVSLILGADRSDTDDLNRSELNAGAAI